MNKKIPVLLSFLVFFIFSLTPASQAASLSRQTLQNDLNYYRKTAREKNLPANDRCYILLKIEKKYKGSGVNLSPLKKEINSLKTNTSPGEPSSGKVEKISVVETEENSKIIITASGIKRYNYFLLRDPEPGKPAKIVLDFFEAGESLSPKAKDIRVKNGIFSRVRSGQFEEKPNRIVRVAAEMRRETPYKILKEDNRWIIQADKKTRGNIPDKTAVQPVTETNVSTPAAVSLPADAPKPAPDTAVKKKTDNYQIEIGDVLGISVFPADELSREAVVQVDGKIPFPLIGSVKARGLTSGQLGELMSGNLSRYVSNPQVTVTMKQFSRRQIFITGEVRSVGAYNYKENLRLLEFISSLGGFTENANRKEIRIYRGNANKRQIHTVNVEDVILSGDFSRDFLLEPGDIIEVPQGRSRVAILGDIRNPGYYDYKENFHLLELISLAGGFNDTAKISKISILRQDGDKDPSVFKVNLKKILSGDEKDATVRNGDTVYIPKRSIATANWFVNNILPWLSLISLVLVIRAGI